MEESKDKYYKNKKKWQERNRNKHKKACRNWDKKNKQKRNENQKRYVKRNPNKIKAHNLSAHIKIPKNQVCQECKRDLAVEKHHSDYLKPLEVMFVCRNCHQQLNKKEITI